MIGDYPIHAVLPASDIERAKAWYKDKLGLEPVEEDPGGLHYKVGGTDFSVFPTQFAGTAQNTAAEWSVDDLEKEVDELTVRGVVFEQYDYGPEFKTNEKGIATLGPFLGAWFKDSEGNIIALSQRTG